MSLQIEEEQINKMAREVGRSIERTERSLSRSVNYVREQKEFNMRFNDDFVKPAS